MKYLQPLLQSNHTTHRYKNVLLWCAKLLITVACLYFIYEKLSETHPEPGKLALATDHFYLIGIVLLLMPLNWYLEAERWRLSVAHESLSLRQSVVAVLTGQALNWVLPFTLGDIGGRLAVVKNVKKSALALLVIRLLSLAITLCFGSYAVIYHFQLGIPLVAVGLVTFVLLAYVLMRIYGSDQQLVYYQIVGLTFLRYAVFTAQFVWVIMAFLPELPLSVIVPGVGWIFLFRTVVPSLFGNFGVREASALVFFENILPVPGLILVPCLVIWIINTIIPSLAGALLIVFSPVKIK